MHQPSLKKNDRAWSTDCAAGFTGILFFSSDEAVILATPMSSIVQLILCLGFMMILKRREKQ